MTIGLKRHASLLLTLTMLGMAGAAPVCAQQLAASFGAPWMEEEAEAAPAPRAKVLPDMEEVEVKPLSLADLQNMVEGDRKFFKAAGKATPIEDMYSDRAGEYLELFGYDLFEKGAKPSETIPAGVVQDNYILSVGDRIEIVIKGQENARKTYEINTRGELITDHFTTLAASGLTLGDVANTLKDEAARLHNVEISVALTAPRQISVLVIGDVEKPGRKTMTAFHTVLEALQQADGIRKSGSLRRIKLVRGGKSEFIDLYSVMMQGGSNADKQLRDGDRIIVPPIGPTVAISGAVKRPAVYEIRKGDNLSALQMLGLAGGVLAPGSNRFVRLSLGSDGREIVQDIDEPGRKIFSDGAILNVAQATAKRSENVELSGHTRDPGQHDLKKARTLSELIKSEQVFGDSLYPLIGVIERRDKKSLTKTLIEFSPADAVQKHGDMPLNEGDVVHLFSMEQIRHLAQNVSREPLLKTVAYTKQADDLEIKNGLIASFLEERSAFVRGAVRQPGAYPVAAGTRLEAVLAAAGGMTVEADADNIEVTSRMIPVDEEMDAAAPNRKTVSLASLTMNKVDIAPGDTVRVNQKFNRVEERSITLLGEVRHPGKYDLMPGDTMLDLIKRAGGLSTIAYPDGVIFSRASERRQEEARYKAQARDLEMKLAETMRQDDKDKKPDMTQIASAQALISQLKDARAVGRITVQADPSILTADPEQDILLEAGDKIYIPRRPLTVRVGGEVLSPAALQFRKGKDADTYIEQAGGTTYYADKDRAFVVYPDGSAKPLAVSAWKQSVTMIPPGSTIIVPRDPKPFDFLESAETISTILANIALTGFYIDDLGDDD
ncbi:MAG TPA: SLBB domain-containing protein [Micavibrio sp.]|nr:SLBB domain-containing protein [Micavibrio sp.]